MTEIRKHRWGLYFAVEDYGRPKPPRAVYNGIDVNLLKDIRPVSIDSIRLFVTVHGMIADVTCQASFTNGEQDIDGFFLFPVESVAALYHFEASVGGRKIVAASREKGEHYELNLLEELDGEGILLEETGSEMFTCHVGVVPPDEQVDVMFQYATELSISQEGLVRFTFPSFVPREFHSRFMDFAPGDQMSFRMDEYSFDFFFQGIIAGNYIICDVLSKELLEIEYLDETHHNAKLSLGGSYLPNRDFSFTVKYSDIESPHILVQKGGPQLAYEHVVMNNNCGVFTLFHRLTKAKPKSTKGEFIFCVDRSINMRGLKMELIREALLYFIKGLPMGCYFNIFCFGTMTEPLFKSSRLYNQYNVMKAIKCQLKMRADMGGCGILNMLKTVYNQPIISGHPKQIFILTDASTVTNNHECIDFVLQRSDYARVFTIGISDIVNKQLINGIARAGNGRSHFLRLREKPYNKVLECMKQAMQPALTDLVMEFDTPAGVTCLTIPPTIPANVFSEEKLAVYILFRGKPEDPSDDECCITLTGLIENESYAQTLTFHLSESMVNENLPIHRLALKAEIDDLDKAISSALGADDILENENLIVQASMAANVASRFSPLIGIDVRTGQEVEGFPIIRVRAEDNPYAVDPYAPGSVYRSLSRLTLSRPGLTPSVFVKGIFDRPGAPTTKHYSMADSRIHDFDDEVEDGLEMEYTFKKPKAKTADLDSELALSEVYMAVKDKSEWESFKESLKHPNGLTKFQQPDGYWMLDKRIAYAFGATVSDVKKDNPLRDDIVWTTVLALNWLKRNFLARRTEWKEAEDWARAWLYQQNLEDYSLEELLELASELKHLDGHTLLNPDPPKPVRQISTIDEEAESLPNSIPVQPITYINPTTISIISNDLDHMGEDEYNAGTDEVADITINAVEISAMSKPHDDNVDATRNHPGQLVVSPTQNHAHLSYPLNQTEVNTSVLRRQTSLRQKTTVSHQSSVESTMEVKAVLRCSRGNFLPNLIEESRQHSQGNNQVALNMETSKMVETSRDRIAAVQSTVSCHRTPQPSIRYSFQNQQKLNCLDGKRQVESSPHQFSGSERTQILQDQNSSQGLACEASQRNSSPPDPHGRIGKSMASPDQRTCTLEEAQYHNEEQQSLTPPRTQSPVMQTLPVQLIRSDTDEMSPQSEVKGPVLQGLTQEHPQMKKPDSTNLSGSPLPEASKGPSAPRPKQLPLKYIISTDTRRKRSPEEQESEEKDSYLSSTSGYKSEVDTPITPKPKHSVQAAITHSKTYPVEKKIVKAPDLEKARTKAKPSLKQRLRFLKENLLFNVEIKHCKRHSDLSRMNSLRESIRSGTSVFSWQKGKNKKNFERGTEVTVPCTEGHSPEPPQPRPRSTLIETSSELRSRPETPTSLSFQTEIKEPTPELKINSSSSSLSKLASIDNKEDKVYSAKQQLLNYKDRLSISSDRLHTKRQMQSEL